MRTRSVAFRGVAWTTLLAVLATCGGKPPPTTTNVTAGSNSPLTDQVLVQAKDLPKGLDMRVSSGRQGAPSYDHTKPVDAPAISDADTQALMGRAPAITPDPDDKQAFALRPSSQPVPRTGDTVKTTFPPPASSLLPPVANETGKDLRVLRYMPEGDVPVAPELSVTFSQPMVSVTSQTDAAANVPVKLDPQPKGRWRWIGTRTVLFDPDVRFPQATTYHVTVPAGTKSATGGVLKDKVAFTFETPAPTLVSSYPSSGYPQRLNVPMFVQFDQRIDAKTVLAKIHVTANGKAVAIRMMEPAEFTAKGADKQLASLVDSMKDGQESRWIAFRATADFAPDTAVHVEIPTGTPSAEGPNVTKNPQSFDFHTYPPLAIIDQNCKPNDNCYAGSPLYITFNNPLDDDAFDPAKIVITPEIPGAKIMGQGQSLLVYGQTEARTTYKVVVPSATKDTFGQTLGKDQTRSFDIHDAQPAFYGPQGMVVVDPQAKKPTLDFYTTNYDNLKVQLYSVQPSDLDAYGFYQQNRWNHDHKPTMPGKKVFDGLVKTTGGTNSLQQTSLDLTAALNKNTLGHVIAVVEPSPWTQTYPPPQLITWVQVTKLGIDAHVDSDDLVAYATELASGKPASGVQLSIEPFHISGTTDDKGTATLPLAKPTGIKGSHFLTARRGDDIALVSETNGYWNQTGSWVKQPRNEYLAWYVIDDRKMYKPGEDVTLKGWLRQLDPGKGGDVDGLANGAVASVSYTVTDSRSNKIATGSAPVDALGGFDTKFKLPKTPNLGYAYITFQAQGGRMSGSYSHMLQVEEFRTPEFEVSAAASQGPFLIGGNGDITVNAKYYSGGPLGGAPVNWYLTASQTSFTPPNNDQYIFGSWTPWWGGRDWYDEEGGYRYEAPKSWQLADKTDASGAHVLHMDFLSANPSTPMSVVANVSVQDVNRQAWSASAALLVHPSSLYVGLKAKKPFVEKGQPFDLDVVGVDLDGKPAPGASIEVKAVRIEWNYKKGKYVREEVDPQTCQVKMAATAQPCTFATKQGGSYDVTAIIVDAKGRPNQTKMQFWVSGGDLPASRDVTQERVQLIPDKKTYAGGDTAEILVQAPFYPAEGIVSWRRSGMVKMEHIVMTGPTTTIRVPVSEQMVPNLYVQVDLVGAATRVDDHNDPAPNLPKRPAYALGALYLPIPPVKRTLAVTVSPSAAKVAPGEAAKIAVDVKDANGQPVANSEVAVLVVDEAILALSGYQFPNPVDTFYSGRGPDVRDHYLRQYVKLARPDAGSIAGATTTKGAPGHAGTRGRGGNAAPTTTVSTMDGDDLAAAEAPRDQREDRRKDNAKTPRLEKALDEEQSGASQGSGSGQGQQQAIAVRANFNPLAAFAPAVKTDASGKAVADIKMPDNLTRYRVVAIAVAGGKQFGKGESAMTARLPLMVRPSPPRFLNFGDKFELPVVVQNQTDTVMQVQVAARATNATIDGKAGKTVMVPANDRVEVRFPASAALAGTARFQVVASSGKYSDAAEVALPVWTPATTEAFATYGVIDNGATAQPVALPGKVWPQFGGLEVTTASTNLQALTDAMLYLVHYPFECAEQRSSRIMAIAALRDVLTAFKTKDMPSKDALEGSVKADIEHLSQMQNYDGGFAYWDRGYPSEPYLSVYVVSALQHAKAKGFDVPKNMLDRGGAFLKQIESYIPAWYPEDIRRAIQAYALYTRKQMGDLDIAKGKKLFAQWGGPDKITMETDGWMLGTFAQNAGAADERRAIVRYVTNHVSETAGAANFTTSYGDGNYLILSSDRRVDGVMLESLIQEQKDLDLIPKVVTGLLAHRKAGRWLNTQENSYALLALDLYFQTYEKVTPDFVARVWLGNDYAGDHAFKGRTTEYAQIDVPMKDVATHDKQNLTIQKDGKGRLYYRVGMKYAPEDLKMPAADYGFVVARVYEAVDNPKDVARDDKGVWHVKAGARVRVHLTMVNENRRYHVALVDPMPAGLEAMNPALAVTGPIPTDPGEQTSRGRYWWWYGAWYEHQNMRDERVEAFASLLWEGVHEYSYVARATTPGNFVVPPPKAEEMYMPETFGRGASDRLIVE